MRNLLLTAMLLGSAVPAHATNWYAVGAISQSHVSLDSAALDATLSGNGATAVRSSDAGTHYQWRLQLGYRITPYLAIEGGYIDLGKANYDAAFSGGTASAEWTSGGVDLAALGTLPLGEGFSLLGKAGVIDTKTSTTWHSSGLAGLPSGSVAKTTSKPFLGLGASYAIAPRSSLRIEAEHFSSVGSAHLTGSADINIFSLGLTYRL